MGNHGMQYIYQADKINGEISKPYKDVYYMNCRGGKKLIIGGGGLILIYLCSRTVKTIDFRRN